MRHSIQALIVLSALAVSGCGGGTGASPPPAASPTPAETIRAMESRGELPTLDRTATLTGIDADTDGVRDDLERYIDALPDSDPQKKALRQLAHALDLTLVVDLTNEAALRAAAAELSDSINCAWKVYPPETAPKRVEEVRRYAVNTRQRFEAYEKYNQARSGAVIAIPSGDTCK